METGTTTPSGDYHKRSSGKTNRMPRAASRMDDSSSTETANTLDTEGDMNEAELLRGTHKNKPLDSTDVNSDRLTHTSSPQETGQIQDELASTPIETSLGSDEASVRASPGDSEAENSHTADEGVKEGRTTQIVRGSWRILAQALDSLNRKTRDTLNSISNNIRQNTDRVDRDLKKKPYGYVLGALGVGITIAKIIL